MRQFVNLKKNVSPFRWKPKSYKRYVTSIEVHWSSEKQKATMKKLSCILAEVGNLGVELDQAKAALADLQSGARNDHNASFLTYLMQKCQMVKMKTTT